MVVSQLNIIDLCLQNDNNETSTNQTRNMRKKITPKNILALIISLNKIGDEPFSVLRR